MMVHYIRSFALLGVIVHRSEHNTDIRYITPYAKTRLITRCERLLSPYLSTENEGARSTVRMLAV